MNKDSDNFEINLLPIISLLAVLISFLLLSTAWIHISSLGVKQSVGSESSLAENKKRAALNVSWNEKTLIIEVKNIKSRFKRISLATKSIEKDFEKWVIKIVNQHPEITMAFVQPRSQTPYQSLIQVIEALKKNNVKDVGISPLQI